MAELIKYGKIRRHGIPDNASLLMGEHRIIVQEKYDGCNGRCLVSNGELLFGSRNVVFSNPEHEAKNMKNAFDTIRKAFADNPAMYTTYDNTIIFFEIMIKHTLSYDWDRTPPLVVIDAYSTTTEDYNHITAETFAGDSGLHMARTLHEGSVPDTVKYLDRILPDNFPQSEFAEFPVEGVVIKNYGIQLFSKYVREEFKEQNREKFGLAWQDKTELMAGTIRLLNKYCTEVRVMKCARKLHYEEDYPMDMRMMRELPNRVLADIIAEQENEVWTSNIKVDFGMFRKMLGKQCAKTLAINLDFRNTGKGLTTEEPVVEENTIEQSEKAKENNGENKHEN